MCSNFDINNTLVPLEQAYKEEHSCKNENMQFVLRLSDKVHEIYQKYPRIVTSPFNLFKILEKDDEMTDSKILKVLISSQENGKWENLHSFLQMLFDVKPNISIESPSFATEYTNKFVDGRIDLLIYEKDKYAIIIENKSNNAGYQDNQLAKYIDMILAEGYKQSQIYVILLEDNHQPSEQAAIWESQKKSESGDSINYEEIFKPRFRDCSFKENILPWVRKILDNNPPNEIFKSLVIQYIDYLEQKYEPHKYYKQRMEEIHKYLKEALFLNGDPTDDVSTLSIKVNDVSHALDHLKDLQKSAVDQFMNYLERRLKNAFPENEVVRKNYCDGKYPTVALFLQKQNMHSKISIPFQVNLNNGNQYYGIAPIDKETRETKREQTAMVVQKIGGFKKGSGWCYFKYICYEDAFSSMTELINKLKEQGWS